MAETNSQVYIHVIMVVKKNQHSIPGDKQHPLHEFIMETLGTNNQKPIIVNGTTDHVHILLAMNPNYSISEIVRETRNATTTFINRNKWVRGRFCWQPSYAAFSYSQSQVEALVRHIQNQEAFHQHTTCRQEFTEFLKKYNIEYDERYLFCFPEEGR